MTAPRPRAKFPSRFHGCKSKATSWTSMARKPDQHLAPPRLSASKSVEQRAGRRAVTAARCSRPVAGSSLRLKQTAHQTPSRRGCAVAGGHGTQQKGERPRQGRGVNHESKEETENTHPVKPSSGWREFKEGRREGSGVGRATPAAQWTEE